MSGVRAAVVPAMTSLAFGIYLPYSSLGAHLGMVPLPWSYFPWLAGILLCYCVLTQLVKRIYIHRFGQWL